MCVALQHVPRMVTSGGDESRLKAETVRRRPCCMYIIRLVLRSVFLGRGVVQSSSSQWLYEKISSVHGRPCLYRCNDQSM